MEGAILILKELEKRGFKAYIVGGAVRDKLMGKIPQDVDILTTAPPGVVEEIGKRSQWKVKGVGRAFGVSLLILDGKPYEVAAARKESYGLDSHRPEKVEYTSNIKQDLSRRDFTINSMAMDTKGRILDPFNGRDDLEKGIIRAVGDPQERFREDALRSFRAVRFAAQLGFDIEDRTLAAIKTCRDRIAGLSVERVRDELIKILISTHVSKGLGTLVDTGLAGCICRCTENGVNREVGILPEILHLVDLPQSPRYHTLDGFRHTLAVVQNTPPDITLRTAALLHDIAKGLPGIRTRNKRGELSDPGHHRLGAEMAEDIMKRLKFPQHIARRVVWLVYNHMSLPEPRKKTVIRWLRKRAPQFKSQDEFSEAIRQLLILFRADIGGGMRDPDYSRLEESEVIMLDIIKTIPFYQEELHIKGERVAERLGAGPQVGRFLNSLLERIQSGQLSNTEKDLEDALDRKFYRSKIL